MIPMNFTEVSMNFLEFFMNFPEILRPCKFFFCDHAVFRTPLDFSGGHYISPMTRVL